DAMSGRISVERRYQVEELRLARVGRQRVQPARHADFLAGFPLVPDINLAGRVVADQYRRQARAGSVLLGKGGYLCGNLRLHGLSELLPLNYPPPPLSSVHFSLPLVPLYR